jgi:hypothetical protein
MDYLVYLSSPAGNSLHEILGIGQSTFGQPRLLHEQLQGHTRAMACDVRFV